MIKYSDGVVEGKGFGELTQDDLDDFYYHQSIHCLAKMRQALLLNHGHLLNIDELYRCITDQRDELEQWFLKLDDEAKRREVGWVYDFLAECEVTCARIHREVREYGWKAHGVRI